MSNSVNAMPGTLPSISHWERSRPFVKKTPAAHRIWTGRANPLKTNKRSYHCGMFGCLNKSDKRTTSVARKSIVMHAQTRSFIALEITARTNGSIASNNKATPSHEVRKTSAPGISYHLNIMELGM